MSITMSNTDIKLMSVKEIAELLGLDRATIATWKHQDKLPAVEWHVAGGVPVWTDKTIKSWASQDGFVQSRINTRAKTRLSK